MFIPCWRAMPPYSSIRIMQFTQFINKKVKNLWAYRPSQCHSIPLAMTLVVKLKSVGMWLTIEMSRGTEVAVDSFEIER